MALKRRALLQSNLNHSAGAQDLFLQTLAENDCEIGIAAKPYRVPINSPLLGSGHDWLGGDNLEVEERGLVV